MNVACNLVKIAHIILNVRTYYLVKLKKTHFGYDALNGKDRHGVRRPHLAWYITWPCDIDLGPLTLNICSVSSVTWSYIRKQLESWVKAADWPRQRPTSWRRVTLQLQSVILQQRFCETVDWTRCKHSGKNTSSQRWIPCDRRYLSRRLPAWFIRRIALYHCTTQKILNGIHRRQSPARRGK